MNRFQIWARLIAIRLSVDRDQLGVFGDREQGEEGSRSFVILVLSDLG